MEVPAAPAPHAQLRRSSPAQHQAPVLTAAHATAEPWVRNLSCGASQRTPLLPGARAADANLRSKTADLQQTSVQQQQQMGQYDRLAPSTPLVPPTAGAGRFRATLCGCFDDCCVCWAVCCCHWITTGQLYERAVKRRPSASV